MLRRLLLAVLFCLSAWTWTQANRAPAGDGAAALAAVAEADATPVSIAATVATPPIDTHPPEARWEALLPYGIGGGSSWSQQLQAVDLPGVSSRAPWPTGYRAQASPHAARYRPPHLLHTPLLI